MSSVVVDVCFVYSLLQIPFKWIWRVMSKNAIFPFALHFIHTMYFHQVVHFSIHVYFPFIHFIFCQQMSIVFYNLLVTFFLP